MKGAMDMTRPIFIEGKRTYLRPLEMEDTEKYYEWYNNPELRRFMMLPFPMTRLGEKDYIERMGKSREDIVFAIVLKKGDRLIGNVGFHRIDRVSRCAWLGIAIGDPAMVSKGFGTDVLKLMVDYGFRTQNFHRIELQVHEFNERALAAYRKVGFIEEGRRREAVYSGGKYHDSILLSILKDEWLKGS